jgi:hypothetical protein
MRMEDEAPENTEKVNSKELHLKEYGLGLV